MQFNRPTFRKSLWLLAAVLCSQLVLAGCGIFSPQEKNNSKPPDNQPFPTATTKDVLIDNFRRCYADKNIDEYEKVLHDDFTFFFAPNDVNTLGVPPQWTRTIEITSTTNMFTLKPGTTPENQEQPPIQSFNISLDPVSAWTDVVPSEFAGTERRDYRVTMTVNYVGGGIDQVGGIQEFYVVPMVVNNQTVYQLKFWRDTGVS